MKHLILISIFSISFYSNGQQPDYKKAWLEKWENSKSYLIEITEAMPEEHYDFKPTEVQMTFKEQLLHIRANMLWLAGSYFSKDKLDSAILDAGAMDKESLVGLLSKAFDDVTVVVDKSDKTQWDETVDFFAGPKSRLQIMGLLQDHVTHHRGQLIVYLNLKGIKPPGYLGW